MTGRVDAIDPELSRERVVSRRADRTTDCANRAVVEGESLSALIAVIKFENLPDPPPTKILRFRISNRSWAYFQYCHAPKRIISKHFGKQCRCAIRFPKKNHTFNREIRDLKYFLVFLNFAENHFLSIRLCFNHTK